ncbi:transporter [Aquirufa antheringensis]|uniref:transporter n=1 Tax=Aquirufa antheringensis TaxID=2516559 RepID=UPI0022A8302D|nr:transporter [Aquirufa antheringensis]MCZ2478550.1 transporter [Aquirufa antheringensis]
MFTRVLILFLISFAAFSQSEGRIETDRPDQTECPFIVKKGYLQAELGFNRSSREYLFPTSLVKYGLSKRLELRYVSVLAKEPGMETRFQTEAFGFKWAIFQPSGVQSSGWIPRTSVIVHYNWDHQNWDFSEKNLRGHSIGDVVFTMQNDFNERSGIGYNIGTEMHSNGSFEGIYRIAPNVLIGKKGYAYVEVFGRFPASEFADHSYDAGFAYYVNDDLKLDISAGQSFLHPEDQYIAIGLSFRLRIAR